MIKHRNTLKAAILIPLMLLTTGCASLQNAGSTSFTADPYISPKGEILCCIVKYDSGKEIAMVHAEVHKVGSDYSLVLDETGIKAFEGQQISADAAKLVAKTAAESAVAIMLAPVAGAALAAPGVLPALAGGAAVIATQKLK